MLGNIIKPLVKGGVDDFAKAVARGAGSVADDAAKAAVKGASSGVDDAAKAAVRSSGDNVATAAVGKTKIAQPVERHLRDPGMNPRLRGLEPAPPSPLKPEIKEQYRNFETQHRSNAGLSSIVSRLYPMIV